MSANSTTLLFDNSVAKGTAPVYEGEAPTMQSTADADFTFEGWKMNDSEDVITSEGLASVTLDADATFTASFKEVKVDNVAKAISALEARFIKGGTPGTTLTTDGTDYAAFALYQLGLESQVDADAIKTAFLKDTDATTDPGQMARWILAMTAAGLDASAVTLDDQKRNLIEEMMALYASDEALANLKASQLVWILPVFENYSTTDAMKQALVTQLINQQSAEADSTGMFEDSYLTTAQAVLALAPYVYTEAEDGTVTHASPLGKEGGEVVNGVIEKAQTALAAAQQDDGGFIEKAKDTENDVATSAFVVAAYAALGDEYPTVGDSKLSPLDYLVSNLDADMAGYKGAITDADGEASAAALALMAFEASKMTTAANKTTNVLEFPVRTTQKTTTNTNTTTTASTASTAKTGDATAPLAAGVGAVAVAALGVTVFARRRQS